MSSGTHQYQPAREKTITTTGNIDDLDLEGCGQLRLNNATLATLRGLRGGFHGQRVTIISVGAGQVDLAHQNTNSLAGNRLTNLVTSGTTSLGAGVGVAVYEYDGTTLSWRLLVHEQGAWIVVPFLAGNFTANGSMTWTVASGDQKAFRYMVRGRTLFVMYNIDTTTVGGTPSTILLMALPNSFSCPTAADSQYTTFCFVKDAGTRGSGFAVSGAISATTFSMVKQDGTNWSASTDTTTVNGIAMCDLV